MNEKILIIEDDQAIVRVLKRSLTYEGYLVEAEFDGEKGFQKYQQFRPDVIVLDWMLPGIDGIEVCDRIRANDDNTPILMLTAKDTTHDRVQGLDSGVDDYMVKPFEIDELNARVRALLRRTKPERSVILSFNDLELDTTTRLASRNGRSINLTAKEYDLLELFLRHPKQVLTRDIIFDRVWGYDFGGESNVLDVYIRYLRQKIEEKGETRLLHTVRGVGYVMRELP
ncbi:MAG: DNA-binding response regulator [Chloroflexi bacterium HGW-Chloroflexi-8]|nr:MAG: DNA-binding response regulator [Chloroflexi bacterium HGW-Chloroflexi-8]